MKVQINYLIIVLVILLQFGLSEQAMSESQTVPVKTSPLYFEKDVRPILKAMCFHCHGEEEHLQGGLDLRLVRLMQSGGDSGEGLIPGDFSSSLLWQRIESDEMPEGSKKLSAKDKETIRSWIAAGCSTLRPEPEDVEDARYTPEELNFWAFRPIVNPSVPSTNQVIDNPIDAFIAARMEREGLEFSTEADRATLLRRLTFDLIGLPPTPDELKNFIDDKTGNAYAKIVDRLLESNQYGVRWGRYWLDVCGYAETEGNVGEDTSRDEAWRYRDYVINAFNSDKPYDQFICEQMAGDEMIGGEPDPENARHVELMTATGFLRMGPNLTAKSDSLVDKNQAVAETLKIVSSSILGLTVGCAQCHDHRYDPISAEDYYRFRAVFDAGLPLDDWKKPSERLIDLTPNADREVAAKIEAEAAALESGLDKRRSNLVSEIYVKLVAELPDNIRQQHESLLTKDETTLSEEEKNLLAVHPKVKSKDFIKSSLLLYDEPAFRKFEVEQNAIKALRDTKPKSRMIMCFTEYSDKPPESSIFFRGDPLQKKKVVTPNEIFVLSRQRNDQSIPVDDESLPTSGRRLAYAKQLISGSHPLTARVVVNRIWMHHFGRGIVGTPSDFGLFGERPSHPDLLDWLATDLTNNGWRLKRIHKLIVTSRAYKQSSARAEQSERIDPENRFLSRMNLRRLDAESIRDSMLAVTKLLNLEMGGPSVPVAEDEDGKAVIGKLKTNDGLFAGIDDVGDQKYRRSVFIQVQRSLPLNMLDTFDLPAMTPNCDARKCSTVALQSLWFLNDTLIVEATDAFTEKMYSEPFENNRERVRSAFRRIFSQEATEAELDECDRYLSEQAERFLSDPDPEWQATVSKWPHGADMRALASLYQALLSTNRFLYVE